jgi:hypothetical protein
MPMSARSCARLWESVLPAELCLWEAGTRRRTAGAAFAVRDGGVLVPADVPQMTQRRVR